MLFLTKPLQHIRQISTPIQTFNILQSKLYQITLKATSFLQAVPISHQRKEKTILAGSLGFTYCDHQTEVGENQGQELNPHTHTNKNCNKSSSVLMEAIRKQASRLRETVTKQQQAVFKQFGAVGYGGSDNLNSDDPEGQQHQKLEKLFISTRSGKHFQRDIVRGVEGYIVTGSKQVEIGTKLSDDSRKYGAENTCTSGNTLSKAALTYGRARSQMEKERGNLLKALGTQVAEPLRAMVMGAPLEDARHLAQRYDRMRQEAEAQAIEVSKRQAKVRESMGNPELTSKLEAAETKLHELKSNVATLGKEAAAAMSAVEAQQQRLTLQRLIAMVESERSYHSRVLQILDQLESEMVSERQRIEAPTSPEVDHSMPPPPSYDEVNGVSASAFEGATDSMGYFLGEVMHSYQAESDVELSLSVGDYVVVRKVSNNGWAEGECKGKAGWFPFGFVERRDRVLASKVAAEVF